MTGIVFAIAMQATAAITGAVPASQTVSYAAAYKALTEQGRPMVILVGADWCPACVQMKDNVIPRARQQGVFNQVSLVMVNTDHDPKLARQLMRGGSIPQLIYYQKTGDNWYRDQLTGGQSLSDLAQFVAKITQPNTERLTSLQGK